jgi:hypothetical protein
VEDVADLTRKDDPVSNPYADPVVELHIPTPMSIDPGAGCPQARVYDEEQAVHLQSHSVGFGREPATIVFNEQDHLWFDEKNFHHKKN